jgi:hypothetical protein
MPDPVYVLERLHWRFAGPGWLCLPGADSLATFPDRAAAEAAARDREWAVRRRVNPFRCGGEYLHYQTSFDAARLHDWFLDLGLEPPDPTTASGSWAAAWDRALPQMTDAQRAAGWEVLDRVRFFRVVERPEGRPMHVVALPHFEEDPIRVSRDLDRYVGSTPYMLVRQRATADELCNQLYVTRLTQEGAYTGQPSDEQYWETKDPDPFQDDDLDWTGGEGVPWEYAEHRPLDLVAAREPTPGHTVYVVLRRHWRLKLPDESFWRWSRTQAKTCGRPVAAFDTLAAADARMAELEAEARRYPSPFRFGPPHGWSAFHDPAAIWGVLSELAPIEFTNAGADYTAPDRLWARWWDEAVPGLRADEIATAWGLYDRLKFYEVVAVEYRE